MDTIESKNHGDKIFVFTETITPIKGRADDILAIALNSAQALKGQPGLIQSMTTRSEKKNGEVCTTSIWSSKADFQNFMKTDQVAELLKSDDMRNIKAWMSDYNMLMSDLVEGWHP